MDDILKSNSPGLKPTVNQLLTTRLGWGWNIPDAKLWGLQIVGGVKTVILIAQGIPAGISHNQLHSMISAADHAAAASPDYNKLVATNPSTGAIEFIEKSTVGTGAPIIIPDLQLRLTCDSNNYSLKKLEAWYISSELKFLDYNPEIWLFRWVKANYYYNVTKPAWAQRTYSTKWRHPTKWDLDDPLQNKHVTFACPDESNQVELIDFIPTEWSVFDSGTGIATIKRKSRTKLMVNISDALGTSISVNFGLAIAIDNPENAGAASQDWVRPYKIWGNVSRFRLISEVANPLGTGNTIRNIIKLIK